MNEIKTYGDLLEAIKNTEKSIENVRNGPYYEQGDEMDLQLYLIDLRRIKNKNERKWRELQRFGLYECDECGSVELIISKTRNIRQIGTDYHVTCTKCNYEKTVFISGYEIKSMVEDEAFESQFGHIFG